MVDFIHVVYLETCVEMIQRINNDKIGFLLVIICYLLNKKWNKGKYLTKKHSANLQENLTFPPNYIGYSQISCFIQLIAR